jgi:phosphohistidine phosphatase
MKTLLLLRHAKASWDDASLRDFDRPLNSRGLKAASLTGEFISKQGLRPDLVISSPAERAGRTAALVLEAARLSVELHFDERIYEASVPLLLEVVSQIDAAANTVLLVGHNPGMEGLLESLTGEVRRMPTAALARIGLDVDEWSEAGERTGRLQWLMKPKELTAG